MKMIKTAALVMGLLLTGNAFATTVWNCDLRETGTYIPTKHFPKAAIIYDYGDSFSVEIGGDILFETPRLSPTGNFNILSGTVNGVTMRIRPTFDTRYYIEDRNSKLFYKFEKCEEVQ